MDLRNTLKNLGLDEIEANVYMALLQYGGSQASHVAKTVGLKRTTIYPILKGLAHKGFVNVYYRKNRQFYYAERPVRVFSFLQKRVDAFNSLIPTLEAMEKKQTAAIGLRFIETKEELEDFYRGILVEYRHRSYRIISSAKGWEGIDPEFFIQFRKDRGRAQIRTRLLLSADSKEINPTDAALLREWKYLPTQCQFRSTIDIYDDKVLVVSPELSSLAVVIAIPVMTDVFKSVFDALWKLVPVEGLSVNPDSK